VRQAHHLCNTAGEHSMAQKGLQPLPYLLSPETYQACTWAYLPEAVDGQRPRTCLENGGTREWVGLPVGAV
jgi:hypothetical protein